MIARRTFLMGAAAGAAVIAGRLPGVSWAQGADASPLKIPPLDEGRMNGGVRRFALELARGSVSFQPGRRTATLGVNGDFLGPVLRMRAGDRVRFDVRNGIGEPTTVHWHGFRLPAAADGGPHQTIAAGDVWSPAFEIRQHAATYWYHSHMLHRTGEQVNRGLAGLMIVDDDESGALALPKDYGIDDIPLVIQDRSFDEAGNFRYVSAMPHVMMGFRGGTILVNGTLKPYFAATRQLIRFRILNGSNARTYNLGLSDGRAFSQIAGDGSLLERPVERTRLLLAPGERAEIVVDTGSGASLMLRSYASPIRPAGMMGRMMGGAAGGDAQEFDVLEIRPAAKPATSPPLPQKLVSLARLDPADAARTRRFRLDMGMGPGMMMRGRNKIMSINGKPMDKSRIDEIVRLNDIEIWEIRNPSVLAHPFHIHDVQFQILDRNGKPPGAGETGFKDTVLVAPNETVRLVMRFEYHSDPELAYMYHCHILEHEDAGMMGQFTVVA